MQYFIYQLVDPRDNLPRYVGITQSMKARYDQHVAGELSNLQKNAWVQDLRRVNLLPLMKELERIDSSEFEALQRERHWIRSLIENGMPLVNKMGVVAEPMEKISFYLTPDEARKLNDLEYEQRNRTGRRVNRNDLIRHLIDTCTSESFEGM